MNERLFIALPISKSIQQLVSHFQKEHENFPVRFIPLENLHITIVPPWYVENTEIIKQQFLKLNESADFKNLKKNLSQNSPHIILKKILLGPNPQKPRLIWAEGETPSFLPLLKEVLEKYFHITAEKRSFKLHLTLARFSEEDFKFFPDKNFIENILWKDEIQSICLLKSELLPRGAKYTKLAELAL